jgi:DNA-binding beta-propeller fold protein YncE
MAKAPGFADVDLDGGRAYVMAKWGSTLAVVDMKTERVLRYIELGGFRIGYGVAATPDKKYLYIPLGVPEQSAATVIDAETLTVVTNIVNTDFNGPRAVRFTNN